MKTRHLVSLVTGILIFSVLVPICLSIWLAHRQAEDKFVDALRATAAQMTMHELQDTRENFVQGVQNTVAEDLSKNGLELEENEQEVS